MLCRRITFHRNTQLPNRECSEWDKGASKNSVPKLNPNSSCKLKSVSSADFMPGKQVEPFAISLTGAVSGKFVLEHPRSYNLDSA